MQDFKTLQALAHQYKSLPIYKAIPQNELSVTETFKVLKNISRHAFILESLEDEKNTGRYTFLGYDPKLEISCKDGVLTVKKGQNTDTVKNASPKEHIWQIIKENFSPRVEALPPFTGGLVGYFSYDFIKYAEKTLKLDGEDAEDFKDVDLMFFDKVIAFDNLKKKIFLIVNITTDNFEKNHRAALDELENMNRLINSKEKADIPKLKFTSAFRSLFDRKKYCLMVEQAKRYIKEGDIFQVVLSNRLDADAEGSLFGTYEILRKTNPSPYMFYFSSDKVEIAGASPETLVKLNGTKVSTFPLAGTRVRGKNEKEDKALEKELLHDPKELAEHNMLVDLGRNDIGKISKFGSVKVQKYLSIIRFSHVMHIGSVVSGEITEDKNALDAIDAVLPAGTLSGAPKIRACEIIHELEGSKRGIYGGAIGYISLTGDMDTCIAIRIAFKKDGKVYVRSGAGIVADSIPKNEFTECTNKAQAVINALNLAAKEA
ncbi:MAG: anthranilate synthase component I family protein [Campylobacteraceae bacterium]|nr:anthranilate synthase component I family protein [Campylobacteraceae bacterium]